VLLVGVARPEGFSETERDLAETLVETTRSALERAARERTRREQGGALERRTRRPKRLDETVEILRAGSDILADAHSRDEIERAVCERVTEMDPIRFAWFGRKDPATGTIEPRHEAGDGQGYLDTLLASGDGIEQSPGNTALRRNEPHRVRDVSTAQTAGAWREHALERGFRSVSSVPVASGDSTYGVLSVYSGRPGFFDERIGAALQEYTTLAAHAIQSVKRNRAIVSERVTEVELEITDPSFPALRFASYTDSRVELEGVVPADDTSLRTFVRVEDADPDDVAAFASRSPVVERIDPITATGDEQWYECEIDDSCFIHRLLDRGAVVQRLSAHDGTARLVVHLPREGSVREFVDRFTRRYSPVDLIGRRDRDIPPQPRQSFRREMEEELSDRQLEILTTAYWGGYFEWPRDRTGEEIAEVLGVTQPTVNRHLRNAQRKILSLLFDRDRG